MGDYASSPLDEAEIGLFLGKRRSLRFVASLEIACRGRDGAVYSARTVDISRGGMLVEITDPRFERYDVTGPLVPFASGVMLRFPEGIEVDFGDGTIRAHAEIVRLASAPEAPCGMRIGCRFEPPLGAMECGILGIDPEFDETAP